MSKIQKFRTGVQALFLVLTVATFFVNFRITMLVIMGLTLLSGVFYCGWICPYGFMQDFFSKLGVLLGIEKRKMPIAVQKILIFSRYIIFGLVFLVGSDIMLSIMSFDPRANFEKILLGNVVSISAITVICFFVLVSLFFERPFCNYLCYEGAKYGFVSIFRLFTIKRNKATCINCKKCDRACPMNIEVSNSTNLRSPQCINCFQCVSSCPVKDTLKYGKVTMNKGEKKKYFSISAGMLVLISTLLLYNIFNQAPVDKMSMNTDLPSTSDDSLVISGESAENFGVATGVQDGVYTGTGMGFRDTITVEVTIKNQQIVSIEVIKHRDDRKWFYRANTILPNRIIEAQSLDVSLVSGATYSSIGIRDAVKDALEKAK